MESVSGRFAIGVLWKSTGCRVETIRYYERAGLLPTPGRSPGGYRLYGTGHLTRLAFIRRARALGFSIDEVRALLALADHGRRPCAEARGLAATHLEGVRAKIASLKEMERVLRETVSRCGSGKGSHCPLIEALYQDGSAPD
jgi:MerR family mercuric resistance operon transcriptional regulator